jgi:hypothetical protein
MKPWEETWRCVAQTYGDWAGIVDDKDPLRVLYADFRVAKGDEYKASHARAQLASAAPELYRELLKVEWDDGPDRFFPECSRCGNIKPEGHKANCPRAAALKKARGE